MDDEGLYELVAEAVRQGVTEAIGGEEVGLSRRLVEGKVVFLDGEGREVRAIPVQALFKKVTAVREKLRVLEQRLNNHPNLDEGDRAELQGYLTRCYGSLTTFNFLFRDEADRFRGTGG